MANQKNLPQPFTGINSTTQLQNFFTLSGNNLSANAIQFFETLEVRAPMLITETSGIPMSKLSDSLYEDFKEQSFQYIEGDKQIGQWNVVTIPGLIGPQGNFFRQLANLDVNNKIFESKVVWEVAKLKWDNYASSQYWSEFIRLGLFIAGLMVQIFVFHYGDKIEGTKLVLLNILDSILLIFLINFLWKELGQMKGQIRYYLRERWNWFDCAFILITVVYLIYDLVQQAENSFTLRLFSSLSVLLCSVKILTYFRAIQQMSFITRMLIFVFDDMKYFFITLLWMVFAFTLTFNQMQNRWKPEIETTSLFTMTKILYKVLLGDFDQFEEATNEEITDSNFFIWLIFFICTLLLMIIMLNLLIAFVNDSYVQQTQKKDIAFLYERIRLIASIDSDLPSKVFNQFEKKYGNKYLFIFRILQNQLTELSPEGELLKGKLDSLNKKLKIQNQDIFIIKESQIKLLKQLLSKNELGQTGLYGDSQKIGASMETEIAKKLGNYIII